MQELLDKLENQADDQADTIAQMRELVERTGSPPSSAAEECKHPETYWTAKTGLCCSVCEKPMPSSAAEPAPASSPSEACRIHWQYLEEKINNEADYRQRDVLNLEGRLEKLEAWRREQEASPQPSSPWIHCPICKAWSPKDSPGSPPAMESNTTIRPSDVVTESTTAPIPPSSPSDLDTTPIFRVEPCCESVQLTYRKLAADRWLLKCKCGASLAELWTTALVAEATGWT